MELFIKYIGYQIIHFYYVAEIISLLCWGLKTSREITREIHRREVKGDSYYPRLTWGDIIWRIIGCVLPVFNLWMIVYVVVPNIISLIGKFINLFDSPVIPTKEKKND